MVKDAIGRRWQLGTIQVDYNLPQRFKLEYTADDNTKQELLAYCRKHIAKYAMPYDIEFREELPKTLVGKVAYRVLEEEELQRIKAAEEAQAGGAENE